MITYDEKEVIEKHIKMSHDNYIYSDVYLDHYIITNIIKKEKIFIVEIEYFTDDDDLISTKRKVEIESHLIKSQIRETKINSVLND